MSRRAGWLRGVVVALAASCGAFSFAVAQTLAKVDSAGNVIDPAIEVEPGGASGTTRTSPAPEPYVDRVLDPGTIKDDGQDAAADRFDTTGWPRSVRVDYSLLWQGGATSGLHQAISLSGFLDTPNYGAISALANFVSNRSDSVVGSTTNGSATSSIWRIDQRALPLNGGWIANHSIGTTSSVSVPLSYGIGRVFLPTTPLEGLAGQWRRQGELEFNLSAGRVGLFNGYAVNGFSQSGGAILAGGGEMRLFGGAGASSRADAAVQLI
ncbi:MAG: hypothetical protein ABI589_03580, partial [Burkholderiales bacterium]